MSAPPVDWTAKGPRNPHAPLLVTAELPNEVLAWADSLRRAHYPPDRNRLQAHVTLFHALPPSVEEELVDILRDLARRSPPPATIAGIMKLSAGTALAVESPDMVEHHAAVAERMYGLLTRQDAQPLRLHVTIQNKVTAQAAQALQTKMRAQLRPINFRFRAFGLYAWEEGLWRPIKVIVFRG